MAGAEPSPISGLLGEAHYFNQTLAIPETRRRMERFLEIGGQTREVQLSLSKSLDENPFA